MYVCMTPNFLLTVVGMVQELCEVYCMYSCMYICMCVLLPPHIL